jgi:hypothetical protein
VEGPLRTPRSLDGGVFSRTSVRDTPRLVKRFGLVAGRVLLLLTRSSVRELSIPTYETGPFPTIILVDKPLWNRLLTRILVGFSP